MLKHPFFVWVFSVGLVWQWPHLGDLCVIHHTKKNDLYQARSGPQFSNLSENSILNMQLLRFSREQQRRWILCQSWRCKVCHWLRSHAIGAAINMIGSVYDQIEHLMYELIIFKCFRCVALDVSNISGHLHINRWANPFGRPLCRRELRQFFAYMDERCDYMAHRR